MNISLHSSERLFTLKQDFAAIIVITLEQNLMVGSKCPLQFFGGIMQILRSSLFLLTASMGQYISLMRRKHELIKENYIHTKCSLLCSLFSKTAMQILMSCLMSLLQIYKLCPLHVRIHFFKGIMR